MCVRACVFVCVYATVFDGDDDKERPGLIKHIQEETTQENEETTTTTGVHIINIIKEHSAQAEEQRLERANNKERCSGAGQILESAVDP